METAIVVAVVMGGLGLLGTMANAVFSRRSSSESTVAENVTARLELALNLQAGQITRAEERIDRQEGRIHTLEQEVAACHSERDDDRRRYQLELDELRDRIGGS